MNTILESQDMLFKQLNEEENFKKMENNFNIEE